MIETIMDGLECCLELGKVHDPPCFRIDLALDMQLDTKAVAVQPRAFVPGRYLGQAVCRLQGEDLEYTHSAIVSRKRAGTADCQHIEQYRGATQLP